MKKIVFFAALMMALFHSSSAWAYDFSYTYQGQTLYYNIVGGNAVVTFQNASFPSYSNYPTGDIAIPATVLYENNTYVVTSIGNNAFLGCSDITSVSIPNSVTSIELGAFQYCSSLASVTIPNSVTQIDYHAFGYCTSLTSITIGRSVTIINNWAFDGCTSLTSVVFNADSCIYAGTSDYRAFSGCTNVTSFIFGEHVKIIPSNLCYGMVNLTSVSIPNGVTVIGNNAFYGCTGLTSLSIPNSVTIIGNNAFYDCSGLTSVNIPNSVTSIGNSAFNGCTGLTSVNLPNSVTTVGRYAFYGCNSLTAAVYNDSLFVYMPTTYSGSYTIPSGIKVIYCEAFRHCNGLTSVSIPNSVSIIYYGAFANCTGLSSITIPESVTTIGNWAFYGCDSLSTVIFNADSCTNAGVFYAPNNPYAFYGCNSITSFTFGNNVKYIPANLCRGLTGITSITIPNSVVFIGDTSFTSCANLATLTIGNGVTNIPSCAFNDCNHLTNLSLGSGVQSIASEAFIGCNAVLRMTCMAPVPPTASSNPFTNFNTSIPVTVPCNSVTAYQNAAYWGFFTNISGQFYNFSVTPQNPNMGYVTVTTQPDCSNHQAQFSATAYDGFRFVQWSDGNTQNPRSLVVNEDTELQAIFATNSPTQYTITVTSANPSMGSVTGSGTYNSGATATLTATANNGYHFTHWQDNNTENPRTVTVTGNATYTAYFEADGGDDDCPTITSFPWNNTFDENLSCWKTVDADGDGYNWGFYEGYVYSESYSYFDGSNQGLTPDNWLISRKIQIPSSGSYKLSWKAQALNDNYYNEHYTVYVSTSGDNPSNFTTQLYSETLNTPNVVNRSISLQNYQGQTVRIAFRHHNTNDMFVLGIADINIAQNTQGIDDIAIEDFSIYALDGQIVVETELDDEIGIYDIVGRKVDGGSKSRFDVPSLGVYIVRIGDHPARKVVIIK